MHIPPGNYLNFVSSFRKSDMSLKKAFVWENEMANVKEARVLFYVEFSRLMSYSDNVVMYFDWASFGELGFKKRSWSAIGTRSIIDEQYAYRRLHLLMLLGTNKVLSW